jgi:hypothetical protein
MNLNKSQWSFKADGMPEPMNPSMFGPPTPKPTPTKTSTPKPTPSPKKLYVGKGGMPEYRPVGSGNSAMIGGFMGGGGGPFGML